MARVKDPWVRGLRKEGVTQSPEGDIQPTKEIPAFVVEPSCDLPPLSCFPPATSCCPGQTQGSAVVGVCQVVCEGR